MSNMLIHEWDITVVDPYFHFGEGWGLNPAPPLPQMTSYNAITMRTQKLEGLV